MKLNKKSVLLVGLLLIRIAGTAFAAEGLAVTKRRIAVLPNEQRAAWQNYLEHSMRQMKLDREAIDTEIRSHGLKDSFAPTEAVDFKFDSKKPDAWFAGEEALRIADIIVSFQTPTGGWSKHVGMTNEARHPGERFANGTGWHYVGTFDNDATIVQLRFLARVAKATGKAAYRDSFLRGLNYIFMAQYPNGGWPQVYPLEGGYHDHITFNDGAMINFMSLLRDISINPTDFAFLPPNVRNQASASVERGIVCLLDTQITIGARRTAWCQQHDALTLKPAPARAYEMISQSGSESAGIARFLMDLPSPNPRVVDAVHAVAAWLKKVAIYDHEWKSIDGDRQFIERKGASPLWARYYEIGTDRPLFGDRDNSVHYDVREISNERRNGYSWYNAGPASALKQYETWSKRHPMMGNIK